MFKKILIANRGEIALRIMRTCEDMGVGTVAVYSEVDRLAPHVHYADEAYCIGPGPARESYLRIDALIEVAKKSGAEAIHPGYGFLSENPEFARACTDAGLKFIGPPPDVIRTMGNKIKARQMMAKIGVPIVPGTTVGVTSIEEAKKAASKLGYPVTVKPSEGGGGKGMHVASKPEELEGAIKIAASEAASAFNSSEVYLEKFLSPVRHIEVQVLRDHCGTVIHLGERECSIQRRHQKLVEESPSTAVDEGLRSKMTSVAVTAAEAVAYQGVGTVEFLLDKDRNFSFLEMNTRLQVEHTVTELVTGIDLVEEQLYLASGECLRYLQDDIKPRGWVIECRVMAEDPYNNFLPSPGQVEILYEPGGPGVRVDSGVSKGYEIPVFYDPLIAKLVTWGSSRDQAVRRMRRALRDYKILGIHNNIPFLMAVIGTPEFLRGELSTEFLSENANLLEQQPKTNERIAAIVAALMERQKKIQGMRANNHVNGQSTRNLWKVAGRLKGGGRPWL